MLKINYEPEMSIDQIVAFDPERSETHARSPFMNAVCLSFARNGFRSSKEMGSSLGMSDRAFAGAFEALTGHNYMKVRPVLVERKAFLLHRLHPHWSIKRIPTELGFRSHASLWSMLPKEVYKQLEPERKADFMRRVSAEFNRTMK